MDKYRDLIVTLIKNHRKYEGCESILEDIVADVYSHAQVVLQTVSDTDVIASYLAKIVSTSMITVPKKMGITRERKTVVILPEKSENQLQEEDFGYEGVVVDDENEVVNDTLDDNIVQITERDLENVDSINLNSDIQEQEESVHSTDEVTVDKNLVDNLINGVPSNSNDNKTEASSIDELIDDLEPSANIEETNLEEFESLASSDEVVSDGAENAVLKEEIITDENSIPEKNVNLEVVELAEAEALNSGLIEVDEYSEEELILENNFLEKTDSSNFELEELNSPLVFEEFDDLSSDLLEENSEGTENLDLNTEEDSLIVENSLVQEEVSSAGLSTATDTSNDEFMPPSFSCFEYNPEYTKLEVEELREELSAVDKKHPEKQIITVCKLKYKEHKSVEEISSLIGLSTNDVLEVLDNITYITKDL